MKGKRQRKQKPVSDEQVQVLPKGKMNGDLDAPRTTPPPSASVPRKPPNRAPHLRKDLDDKHFDPDTGQLIWPDGKRPGTFPDGFDGPPAKINLAPGTKIDRYGSEGGNFLSPTGTPFADRALPYDQAKMPYRQYEVVKELPVESGRALPWFGEKGGGVQHKTGKSVEDLVREGYLKEIKP
jgi:hypothetical protein